MSVIPGPRILEKITIDYATGNKDTWFTYIPGPRFKERLTIKQGKVSYKITRFVDDLDGTWTYDDTWEYKSTNNRLNTLWGELFWHVVSLEENYEDTFMCDVMPFEITVYYMSNEKEKFIVYPTTPGMEMFMKIVSEMVVPFEELPEFLQFY